MDIMESLSKTEIREFFSKGWMTHDAMWYYNCFQEFGPEKANRLNQNAVKSMAGIEIQRILRLIERTSEPVRTFDDLKNIFDSAMQLIQPSFMKCHYRAPEKNVIEGGFDECFAHDGVKRFGLLEHYECGILTRIRGWLDTLGISYEMKPAFTGCLMRDTGKCKVSFYFNLE